MTKPKRKKTVQILIQVTTTLPLREIRRSSRIGFYIGGKIRSVAQIKELISAVVVQTIEVEMP
jgi:type VI protein secretion system component VasA